MPWLGTFKTRTTKVRNRLILKLMARGGMRIGEVLKLRLKDLQDRKLVLSEPKSGKEYEFVFIPQKVADRLREYALEVMKKRGKNLEKPKIMRHSKA